MTTLAALIERLESATEGSRELDLAIDRWAREQHLPHVSRAQLRYTQSLDAALTLVPGGARYKVGNLRQAWGYDLGRDVFQAALSDTGRRGFITGHAATAALALCIAALRARQSEAG